MVLLVASLSPVALASAQIHGDYCGKAVSGGKWVDVVTSLKTSSDGLLTGSYKFEDNGAMVRGSLREETKQPGETRTLIWADKYGIGNLTMRFAPHYSSFEGKWGVGDATPLFGWNGERCNFDSARNSAEQSSQPDAAIQPEFSPSAALQSAARPSSTTASAAHSYGPDP